MQRINIDSRSILETSSNEKFGKQHIPKLSSRSVQITERGGRQVASANLDESGEYDETMKEWTVHFLRANHTSSCPLESLPDLEIKIGGFQGYISSFGAEKGDIIIRVYNVRSHDKKSFSLTIRNELVLIGQVCGWPEGRSPDCSDDEEFQGTLEQLLLILSSGSLTGVELLIGSIVMKNFILRQSSHTNIDEETPAQWETFE